MERVDVLCTTCYFPITQTFSWRLTNSQQHAQHCFQNDLIALNKLIRFFKNYFCEFSKILNKTKGIKRSNYLELRSTKRKSKVKKMNLKKSIISSEFLLGSQFQLYNGTITSSVRLPISCFAFLFKLHVVSKHTSLTAIFPKSSNSTLDGTS